MDGLREALRFFEAHDFFILTTHEGADADGIGAEILLSKALRRLDKRVRIVNSDSTPARYAFLDPEKSIERWDAAVHQGLSAEAALVILDSDRMNLGVIGKKFLPAIADVFIVDHHEPPTDGNGEGYIDTTASSTSELALEIVLALDVSPDLVSARAALAGIVYDTGSFMYPKTQERTFRAAIKLMEAGAVPNDVYRALYENASVASLLLQKRVFATMDLLERDRVAVQVMLREDILATGAHYEDAENLINIPLHCKEVEVSILFKETEDGILRCSFRSKGAVDVSDLARGFGGGGHRTAAGFKCGKGLAETQKEVLQKVSAALSAVASGG